MRKRITKRSVDALRAGARPVFLWDTDVTGFGCKATPASKKVFIFQYRRRGQDSKTAPKRITLGKYGEKTPDRARSMAANLRLEVKAGGDPAAAWRPGESPTVSDLAERFLQEHLPTKKRPPRDSTIRHYETLFRCHVLPELGSVPVGTVTPTDLEKCHGAMRAKPYAANRMLSLLQQAFDQAERWGWRSQYTNPAVHIDRYSESAEVPRRRSCSTPSRWRSSSRRSRLRRNLAAIPSPAPLFEWSFGPAGGSATSSASSGRTSI
jgi:hypothetical protein